MRVLAGLVLSVAVVLGQPVEATVFLPESLCGLGRIDYLVWNPVNNQVYASSYSAGNVVVLSVGSGEKTTRIPVGDYACGLCVNADLNKVYAFDGGRKTVAVIDGTTNTVVRQVEVPSDLPGEAWLAYSPVRQKLYCLFIDGRLAVLDAVSDSVTRCLRVNNFENTGLVYNAAADKLYGLYTLGICIIDGATDTTRATIILTDAGFTSMVVNDATNKVYFLGPQFIAVVSGTADTLRTALELEGEPVSICCNPGTNRVYAAYEVVEGPYEPAVVVVDGDADTVITAVVLGSEPVSIVSNPALNRVYVGLRDGSVAVIDGATNEVVDSVHVGRYPDVACYAATDNAVFVSSSRRTELAKIDCATNSVTHVEDLGCQPGVIACADEQDRVFVLDRHSGFLNIVDGATHQVRRSYSLPCALASYPSGYDLLAYNRDLGRMYVALGDSGLAIFDCASDSLRRIVNVTSHAIAYDSGRHKVYCAGDSSLWAFEAEAETLGREIPEVIGMSALCLNPVRGMLYAGVYGSYSVTVIDCAADTVACVLPTNSSHTQFEYSPTHDKVYATSDNNGELLVIDCATNQVLRSFRPGGHAIGSVSLNEAGTRLFCSSWTGHDPSLLIDCATDSVVAELDTMLSPQAVWSHDSRRIYACGWWLGVLLVDAVFNRVVDSIRTGYRPADLSLHPTADKVYVAIEGSSSLTIIDDVAGVAERPRVDVAARGRPMSSVARGCLVLPGRWPAVLFDASGRLATELRPGPNDVNRLSPGVYFVREQSASSSQHSGRTQKVAIAR